MMVCKTCKEGKQQIDFYLGRRSCKQCVIERIKKSSDPKAKAAYDKSRREARGSELRDYDRRRAKLLHRRASHNEDTRKRRARLKGAVPDSYDREGVMCMYNLAQKLSIITGVGMHVDHIKPLSKGGEHNTGNLQLLAGALNMAKGSSEDFQLSWKKYK